MTEQPTNKTEQLTGQAERPADKTGHPSEQAGLQTDKSGHPAEQTELQADKSERPSEQTELPGKMEAVSASKSEWQNMATVLFTRRHDLNGLLTDENMRVRLQFFCVYIIFAAVSSVMTAVNVFTDWHLLMLSTFLFAVLNLLNIALSLVSEKTERIARICFAVETGLLFLFFVIVGEPEGFSAIWLVLLPSSGMLLYRMKYGIFLTVGELLIIAFLFWTPIGRSLILYTGYTESFMLRFPLLYTAAAMVGIFFEYIRMKTQSELNEMRTKFEYLYKHDALTGLYNRFGFYNGIQEMASTRPDGGYAFAILDLDHFKNVNDRFGHLHGDTVLKTVADNLGKVVGNAGWISRWGGEEFAIFFHDDSNAEELCGQILNALRAQDYCFSGTTIQVTASIGLIVVGKGNSIPVNDMVAAADKNLYASKEHGRNRITMSSFRTAG